MVTANITLILDADFGERVIALAKTMPIWIISSKLNDPAVEKARHLLHETANITTVLARNTESAGDICLRALYDIDEHHGVDSTSIPYQEILVFGLSPEVLTPEIIHDLGFHSINKTDFGFRIIKQN
ncbi:hypothetical protein ACW9IK_19865 [Pseudomonas gingeri]